MQPYFETEGIKLYHNDCLEVLEQLSGNSVDMIFSDPPYLLSNDGFTCHAGRMVKVNKGEWDRSNGFEEDIIFHEAWIKACRRVLKPEGTIWISGTSHSIYMCGYLLQKNNFHILNDITWYKPNAAPNLSCTVFAHSHETLLWARKDKKARHTYNYDVMKNSSFSEDKLKVPGKQMRSVWSIPTPLQDEKLFGKHPTQKPLALLKRIVAASTSPGHTVLDPFMGSATTALAVMDMQDVSFIGIEIDKGFIELSLNRIKTKSLQPTLALI